MADAKVIIKSQNNISSGINSAKKDLKGFSDAVESLGFNIKGLISTAIIGTAVKSLGQAAIGATKNFAEYERQTNQLSAALEDNQKAFEDTMKIVDEFSKMTMSSKDDVLTMVSTLASLGKSTEEIEKITEASVALANVTGKDLNSAMEIMLDSLNGSVGEIEKYIPEVKNLTEEEKALGGAIDIVNNKFGDLSEEMSSTSTAQSFKNIQDSFDSIGESMGGIIINSLSPAITFLEDKISWFESEMKRLKDESDKYQENISNPAVQQFKDMLNNAQSEYSKALIGLSIGMGTSATSYNNIKKMSDPQFRVSGTDALPKNTELLAFLKDLYKEDPLGYQDFSNTIKELYKGSTYYDGAVLFLDAVNKLNSTSSTEALQLEKQRRVSMGTAGVINVTGAPEKNQEDNTQEDSEKTFSDSYINLITKSIDSLTKVGKDYDKATKELLNPSSDRQKALDKQFESYMTALANIQKGDAESFNKLSEANRIAMESINSYFDTLEAKEKEEAAFQRDPDRLGSDFSNIWSSAIDSDAIRIENLDAISNSFGRLVQVLEPIIQLWKDPVWFILSQMITGFTEALLPALEATIAPITMSLQYLGNTLGQIFIPILKALEPVLRFVGKIVVVVGSVFQWVADWVQYAIGSFLNWIAGLNLFGWKPFEYLKTDVTKPGSLGDTISSGLGQFDDNLNGMDTSTSTGISNASYQGATSVTINIYQQAPVVGDNGMSEFAKMVRQEFEALEYFSA